MSIHKDKDIENNSNVISNSYMDNMMKDIWMNLPGGIFHLYKENNVIKANIVNDKMLDILGCSKEEFSEKYNNEIGRIFDKEVVKKLETIFDENNKDVSLENIEVKMNVYDNTDKWVSISVCRCVNEEKKIYAYMYVINIDNTKQKQYLLRNENETFRNLLNNDADIMFEYDIENNQVTLNMVSEDGTLTEKKMYKFSELIHKSGFIHEQDKEKFFRMVWLDDNTTEEFRIQSLDGSYIWCSIKAIALKDENYMNKKIIGWIKNINDRKQDSQYLKDLEKRDMLTKLFNEEYAQGLISEYLRAEGKNKVSASVIIDIDNFHEINEKVGVVFGDAVLINVASEIKKVIRSDDIIARIGGDKFLVFLKNVEGKEHVIACVKRIQELINNISLGEVNLFEMTCSIGIALNSLKSHKTYEELLRNTDLALYYAKIYGKNRFEIYDKKVMSKSKGNKLYNVYGESIKKYEETGNLEKDVTSEILGIISRTKDIKSGIDKILDVIGRKFGATNVNISQIHNKRFCVTHNWSYNGIVHDDEILSIKVDKSLKERYLGRFIDDLFVVNNIDEVDGLSDAGWLIDKYGIKSFMQVALKDDEELVAIISVLDCQENRNWDDCYCKTLREVSKIMTNYLLQLKESISLANKINEMKNFDMLTGLPLKNNFKTSIKKIIKNNPDKKYVVVNLDFVKFKYINDTCGYNIGDKILKEFARLISRNRFGIIEGCRSFSDNFLFIQEYTSMDNTSILLNQMQEEFSLRLKKKYTGINVGFSIGACVIEDNYGDIMGPIDNSGLARKYAKENGKLLHFFDKEMKKKIQMEFEILNSMESALTHSEFKVYYQPKVNIADGTIAGAEALVRWIKPNDKIVGPDKFIPLFEKNGFVINIDFFVYEEVCRTMRRWLDTEMKVVPISVNVSRLHLADKDKFIKDFVKLIDKYKIPHELIELELTENIFLNNTQIAVTTMAELRKLGFVLSIDDFGSGYSSLNILKDVSSDVLKLDRAFFSKNKLQKEEQIILTSIVDMARKLDIKVLSEGVETTEQSQFLKDIQCDLAQGFLYSKPVPLREFEQMLNEDRSFGVY